MRKKEVARRLEGEDAIEAMEEVLTFKISIIMIIIMILITINIVIINIVIIMTMIITIINRWQ